MIDLHCHYLPGVDDGPEGAEEAIRLVKAAVANGITAAALTPHIHPRRYPNSKTRLLHTFVRFQDLVKKHEIPIKLFLAGEVRVSAESLELFEEDEIPFLGEVDGFKIVLLEFPHDAIPVGTQQFINKLLRMKIRPLIAHPERNKQVMSDPERIRPFVDMGCWLQLTSASLTGGFGEPAKRVAIKLLEQELAWIIATDAHNMAHRPPDLANGMRALTEIVGKRLATRMVDTRPARILGMD
ncbi:tyrosine-protein phosphatase [Undibacterium sp. RuRC25W]|uniref:tyrosine-protein phosphatase n=1 Tax=Undibacterium sp. RuRC25W TaxID=3413047 RepID=UPI003BF2868F